MTGRGPLSRSFCNAFAPARIESRDAVLLGAITCFDALGCVWTCLSSPHAPCPSRSPGSHPSPPLSLPRHATQRNATSVRTASDPGCVTAQLIWQHGTFTRNSNNTLTLNPFEGDGHQQISSRCAQNSNVVMPYNQCVPCRAVPRAPSPSICSHRSSLLG